MSSTDIFTQSAQAISIRTELSKECPRSDASDWILWHLIKVYTVFHTSSSFIQWTLVTTTPFVPEDIAIKTNLLLFRILNEQIDM